MPPVIRSVSPSEHSPTPGPSDLNFSLSQKLSTASNADLTTAWETARQQQSGSSFKGKGRAVTEEGSIQGEAVSSRSDLALAWEGHNLSRASGAILKPGPGPGSSDSADSTSNYLSQPAAVDGLETKPTLALAGSSTPARPSKRSYAHTLTIDDSDEDDDQLLISTTKRRPSTSPKASRKQARGKGKGKARASFTSPLVLGSSSDNEFAPAASASSSTHPHQPSPPSQDTGPIIHDRAAAMAFVLGIIPDVSHAHLDTLLQQQDSVFSKRFNVEAIVDTLLTKGSYPKEGQEEEDRRKEEERERKRDWCDLSTRGNGSVGSVLCKEAA